MTNPEGLCAACVLYFSSRPKLEFIEYGRAGEGGRVVIDGFSERSTSSAVAGVHDAQSLLWRVANGLHGDVSARREVAMLLRVNGVLGAIAARLRGSR